MTTPDPAAAFSESLRSLIAPIVRAELRAALAPVLDKLQTLVDANPPQYISIAEAARRLNCCDLTIRRQVASGALASRRCGKRILIPASALQVVSADEIATAARKARAL